MIRLVKLQFLKGFSYVPQEAACRYLLEIDSSWPLALHSLTPWETWNCFSAKWILLLRPHGDIAHGSAIKTFIFSFLRFYLHLERGEGRGRERERNQCVVASPMAPTGDLAHTPGMCPDWELNWWPLGSKPTLNPLSYTARASNQDFLNTAMSPAGLLRFAQCAFIFPCRWDFVGYCGTFHSCTFGWLHQDPRC